MSAKKKRPPVDDGLDMEEVVSNKKSRQSDGASTSHIAGDKSSKHKTVKIKEEDDIIPPQSTQPSNDDIPDWPEADLMELMKRIEKEIPAKDNLRFDSRAEKLNWSNICFGDYTAEQCKEMWARIQKRLRRFRSLREVLEDAKKWVSKPWTNFYRSQRQNRHPGLPRRPLSTYMLFYLEKKDEVSKENPGLEMTGVSKCIAEMYKSLPAKKKQKYIDMAAMHRKEYEEKLEEFYQEHPEMVPKPLPPREHRSGGSVDSGPRKPTTPFKLFYTDKENRHKNDADFDRADLLEKCREQWRTMNDKKKVVWINWALEEESRYQEELKAYMSANPNFVPSNVKTVLTKEEKNLKERVAGKPEKPPNSGYSLFSRIMLVSPEIKQVAPKERMSQISKLWKGMPDTEKKKYQEQVNHMLDQYKLEYATYLESLPEHKRQEELLNNQPKRKRSKITKKNSIKINKETKKKVKEVSEEKMLYKGEPEPPPVNAYQLFLKSFLTDATHIDLEFREKEAPRYWQMLPDADKAKHRKRLNEIKQKYIKDYEKFLKSLSQEQLKDYSLQKASLKNDDDDDDDEDSPAGDSGSDSDDSSDSKDGNSDNDKDSGSDDDSSSDSDSDSNDSSGSSDSDADNNGNNDSGESSSSSGSDSD